MSGPDRTSGPSPSKMGGLRNLLFGARLALTGGRGTRARTALTTAGVMLGVVLLVFASSIPRMVSAHSDRTAARQPGNTSGPSRLDVLPVTIDFAGGSHEGGVVINGYALERIGYGAAPLPPGVAHLPGPGQMVVSPALRALLDSAAGPRLRRQLGGARVIGTIGPSGLAGPGELYLYLGARGLQQLPDTQPIDSFGEPPSPEIQRAALTLLVIVMVIALLLPIGVFVATASRFGGEERNRRLAALRLVGADRVTTARIAAGESLLGAVIGVLAGLIVFYAVLRPIVPHVHIAGLSVYTSDVDPSLLLLVLVVVLCPAASVLFSLAAMRRVSVEPLGVTRRGSEPRRRLWWRLATPVLGFLLLAPLIGSRSRIDETSGTIELAAGVVLVLVGICALLPWVVESVILRAGSGPVPWLLAVRRLRADQGTAGRVVGAIGLTVAGAIALQTVFAGVEASDAHSTTRASPYGYVATGSNGAMSISRPGEPISNEAIQVSNVPIRRVDTISQVVRRLRAIPGVVEADVTANPTAVSDGATEPTATIADCQAIALIPQSGPCRNGDIFVTGSTHARRLRIGNRSYRLPPRLHLKPFSMNNLGVVNDLGDVSGFTTPLLTPAAAQRLGLEQSVLNAFIYQRSGATSVLQQVETVVSGLSPLTTVQTISSNDIDPTVQKLKDVLTAGAVAVLIVIGFSLLVAVVEQLRERRRVFAALSAFGTKTSTLASSVLWQTGLLLIAGLLLAVVIGIALGAVLMRIASEPVAVDFAPVGELVGVGALIVVAVTALTLPVLWASTRPEALRTE